MIHRSLSFRPALLLALASLAFPAAALQATTISTAREHLAAGDFVKMNEALAPVLRATPTNPEARALRAIARVGVLAETTVPPLLRSAFGAQRAVIDFSQATFDVGFPEYSYTFGKAVAFTPSAGGYASSRLRRFDSGSQVQVINVTNNSGKPFPLTLRFDLGSAVPEFANTLVRFGTSPELPIAGAIFSNRANVTVSAAPGFSTSLLAGPSADEATVIIPPDISADIYLWENTGGAYRFTLTGPDGALPPTLALRNGDGLVTAKPRAARLTSLGLALAPAQTLQSSVAADLAVLPHGFQLVLSPEETGAATSTILAYADARLLLAEIAVLEAFRNLSLSYNLGFQFKPSVFDSQLLDFLAANPAFFTARSDSSGFASARTRARTQLLAAAAYYAEASDAGLWTRPAPASGAYLFTLDPELDAAAEKVRYDTAFAQLVAALSGPVPLEEISSDLAENPAIPDGASADLTPLFGKPIVNLRDAVPAFSDDRQIVRGSSAGLINTGLLPGLDSAGWESFLTGQNLADESQTSSVGVLKIQRQSGPLAVAEGAPALLSVFAEASPAPLYQWQRKVGALYIDVTGIPGAASPTLRIASASRADSGTYRARVTDTRVSPAPAPLFSKDIKLTVTYPPEISVHPQGGVFTPGQSTTLSVNAAGVPETLSYVWRKNGVPILRAAKATHRLVIDADSGGDYDVIVANARGAILSQPAAVRVKPTIVAAPGAAPRRIVHAGTTLNLSYLVRGSGPFTYAWRRENLPLQNPPVLNPVGDGSATLALPGLGSAQAGRYTLQVTTPYGTATSPVTEVWVNLPPASLPPGTTLALTEGGATNTLTVGPTPLRFTDGSTFTYALYGSGTRSNGVLTGATLVRSIGGARSTYQLGFTTARQATYVRFGGLFTGEGTALVTLPSSP